MFGYFTHELNTHEQSVKGHYSRLRNDGKLRFLNKRIEDYRQIVGEDEFIQFIGSHNLGVNEFGANRNLDRIPNSLAYIR